MVLFLEVRSQKRFGTTEVVQEALADLLQVVRKTQPITGSVLKRVVCLTFLLRELHMSGAGRWQRNGATLSSRTLRWLVWLNHGGTTTFIVRFSFWWRWERYGLSILSSGLLAFNVLCFPLSFLWSIILSVVISLQGGKVVGVLAGRAASCSRSWFKAEHVSLIQIHDHISFMALQLWVRCFFSRCHISLNVILHACTHTLQRYTCVLWACARSRTCSSRAHTHSNT